MKRRYYQSSTPLSHSSALTFLVATMGVLLLVTTLLPIFYQTAPTLYSPIELRPLQNSSKQSLYNAAPLQNFTMEGDGDLTAFVVGPDGSLTSTILAAGDVGAFNTAAPHYDECLLALSIFRWGDYLDVLTGLMEVITNDTSGSSELEAMMGILDLLPPNAILMVFMGGSSTEIQIWGDAVHLDFENVLGIQFARIFGMHIPIPNMTVGIEAYGYFGELESSDPIEIQGRDRFQTYMLNLGTSRRGGTELVTPTLANDSIGGVGIAGFINIGVLSGSPSPMKSNMQTPESITMAAWASRHADKFFGSEEQEFNVNEFVERTGTIGIGTLDAFEFTMLFPAGVNITSYTPTDMYNSSSPEGVMVSRTTGHWQNDTTDITNIIINFEGDFPPGLAIRKTITPIIPVGGTATVTIQVTNIDPNETVYEINVDDSHAWDAYLNLPHSNVIITGTTTGYWASIAPGDTETFSYQISITGEGGYVAQRANVTYEDATARVWEKTSNQVYLTVSYTSLLEFLIILLQDIPWSIPVLLIIVLMALYAIIWLIKLLLGLFRKRPAAPPPKSGPPPDTTLKEPLPPPPDEYEPPAKSYPETTCINCGAPIPPGVSFCPACGAKVTED
jgi:hypothetical protein